MDFSKRYFTIIGAEVSGVVGCLLGPVMSEQEIVNACAEKYAAAIPAEQHYDGEKLDAALDCLNNGGRIFEIFECETEAEDFIRRAEEFDGGTEARVIASGWLARKATLKAALS